MGPIDAMVEGGVHQGVMIPLELPLAPAKAAEPPSGQAIRVEPVAEAIAMPSSEPVASVAPAPRSSMPGVTPWPSAQTSAPVAVPATAEPAPQIDIPPPAEKSTTATLNLDSIPVSKVVLDGKPLGNTPKVGISVPPGSHTVLFIHPQQGQRSTTVTVKAGETKTAAVKF